MSQEQSHLYALKEGKISVPANYGSNGDKPKIIYGIEKPSFAKAPAKTYYVPLSDLEIFLDQEEDTGSRLHQINEDTLGRVNSDGGLLIVRTGFPYHDPYGRAVFSKEEFVVIKECIQKCVSSAQQEQ